MDSQRIFWRSPEHREGHDSVRPWADKEFPELEQSSGFNRRHFLQLVGGSAMLAGLTGCDFMRRPEEHVVPYGKRPEEILPGMPTYYATCFPRGGYATGVVVKCNEGRPTKIEGNPDCPISGGSTDAQMQASVLDLYDPDRSKHVVQGGAQASWADWDSFADKHLAGLRQRQGEGLAVISEAQGSLMAQHLRKRFLSLFPKASWVTYEPVNRDEVYAAAAMVAAEAGERTLEPVYDLAKAEVVLSLDGDFMGSGPGSVGHQRAFASGRRPAVAGDPINRLYVVESHYSVTGSLADHRLALSTADMPRFLGSVLNALRALAPATAVPSQPTRAVLRSAEHQRFAAAVARDLWAHRGSAVIVAGEHLPAAVQALALAINHALGAAEVQWLAEVADPSAASSLGDLSVLTTAMRAGKVNTLLVLAGNPVFDAPVDTQFASAVAKVEHVVRLGLYQDETSAVAHWHLPAAHYLEAWGDGYARGGARLMQQPLVAPLYDGRTATQLLAQCVDGGQDVANGGYRFYGVEEATYRSWLHKGVAAERKPATVALGVSWPRLLAKLEAQLQSTPSATELELVFRPDSKVYDGRYANNAWLQELPDAVTKVVWDNAAWIGPETAKEFGLNSGDVVELRAGERKLNLPVWIVPGSANYSLLLSLGYGREDSGRIGTEVGFNAYALRSSSAMWAVSGVKLRSIDRRYPISCTQDHGIATERGSGNMMGRPIVRETTAAAFSARDFDSKDMVPHEVAFPGPERSQLYKTPYDHTLGQQWGMAIDLNACNGCNACVVACQSENNIPIVGKQEVAYGREMHWLRIDRYFASSEETVDKPEMVFQPMPCQQCENAPCETVCPVAATTHTPDGLNDMVYNRCVGTRYCSNNCPVKVRRFNYYNFTKEHMSTQPLPLAQNPDVTVRFRGVMEKCTYCVQRVRRAQADAKNDGHQEVADGTFTSACAQACPAGAIVFGDINDATSKVSQIKRSKRNYSLLPELNLNTRTSYLGRVRNLNPELT